MAGIRVFALRLPSNTKNRCPYGEFTAITKHPPAGPVNPVLDKKTFSFRVSGFVLFIFITFLPACISAEGRLDSDVITSLEDDANISFNKSDAVLTFSLLSPVGSTNRV